MKRLLVVILILSFLIRLFALSAQDIWIDEAFSLYTASMNIEEIITLPDPNPPFYNLFLSFWLWLFGWGIYPARFLSVLIGTGVVYCSFLVCKHFFSERTSIIASLLVAFSPLHIYFSQEARSYSLFLLLALLSTYFYLKDGSLSFSYFLSSLLLVYTHFFGIFILLVHVLYLLKDRVFRPFFTYLAICVLYLPWLLHVYFSGALSSASWIAFPTFSSLLFVPYFFLSGPLYSMAGIALFFLLLIFFRLPKNNFLLLWLFVPVLVPFFLSFIVSIFTPKYVIISSFPLLFVMAEKISQMKGRVILGVILLLGLFSHLLSFSVPLKDPWRDVSSSLDSGPIYVMNFYEVIPLLYYLHPECISLQVYSCGEDHEVYGVRDLDRDFPSSFWLVLSRTDYLSTPLTPSAQYQLESEKRYPTQLYSADIAYLYSFTDLILPESNEIIVRHYVSR